MDQKDVASALEKNASLFHGLHVVVGKGTWKVLVSWKAPNEVGKYSEFEKLGTSTGTFLLSNGGSNFGSDFTNSFYPSSVRSFQLLDIPSCNFQLPF